MSPKLAKVIKPKSIKEFEYGDWFKFWQIQFRI